MYFPLLELPDRGNEPLFSRRGFIQRIPSLTLERGAASNDFRKSF